MSRRVFFLSVFVMLLLPSTTLHAQTQRSMTRGNFIRSAIKALNLPISRQVIKAKDVRRIPASLAPYIREAQERGALDALEDELNLGKPVSRGEAAQIAAALSGLAPQGAMKKFSDVPPRSSLEVAVTIAIEQGWLRPVSTTTFGDTRVLTLREARAFIAKLKKGAMSTEEGTQRISIPIPRGGTRGSSAVDVPKADLLSQVWQLLNEEYLYRDTVKMEDAGYRAIEGLVESLDDPYTVFLRPLASENFWTQLQTKELSGIGAHVELKSGVLTIVSPLKGSPAEAAGLKPGDEILAVDGESLEGIGLEEGVAKIRGPVGTNVLLRIRREGTEFDVTVIRDIIKIPEIEISGQGTIAIVKIYQFGATTDRELRSALEKVQQERPTGLVLDLRNNPGGFLHAAEIVLSNFLPQGSTVATIRAEGAEKLEKTQDPPTIDASVRMAVLINKGSASASEIVAGALQDAKRATVIGEQSFGKGTVQRVVDFPDGSSLKYTVAEYQTPAGHKVDGVGIKPDIVVESTDLGARDEQMLRALELLR